MVSYVASHYTCNVDEADWIIGIPRDTARHAWRHDAQWEMFGRPVHSHSVSTFDYRQALTTLHTLWESIHDSEFIVVASVGSKAQHLGTFMFLVMHPEIGLVVSEPKQFTASRYSEGTGDKWWLSLGTVGAFATMLRGWNKLEFAW